jgi:hypothetical protein
MLPGNKCGRFAARKVNLHMLNIYFAIRCGGDVGVSVI